MAERYNILTRCLAAVALLFVYVASTSAILVGATTSPAQAYRGYGGRGYGYRGYGGYRGRIAAIAVAVTGIPATGTVTLAHGAGLTAPAIAFVGSDFGRIVVSAYGEVKNQARRKPARLIFLWRCVVFRSQKFCRPVVSNRGRCWSDSCRAGAAARAPPPSPAGRATRPVRAGKWTSPTISPSRGCLPQARSREPAGPLPAAEAAAFSQRCQSRWGR